MRFDEHFLKRTLPDVSIVRGNFPEEIQFSIDSRTIQAGEIFIAISGSVFDGHDFVVEVFKKGARGCILAHDKKNIIQSIPEQYLKDALIITVPDTLHALLTLAKAWRALYAYPVIGITGTVGKTSTKELLNQLCMLHGLSVVASHANQNTLLGAAINIFRMRATHDIAIFEMGIARRGEMAELADLVSPTVAVITNIGHQHMNGLGSLHDIATEKRTIFKNFESHNIGIINGDQPLLAEVSYTHPVMKFGYKMINQIQARKIRVTGAGISFVLKIYGKRYSVAVPKTHKGIVENALAVVSVAQLLQIPDKTVLQAIQNPIVVEGRFEECKIKDDKGIIINDCYNANPESVKAALLAFQEIETSAPKIAVLGDMLGLGVNSPFWHRQIGRFLRKAPSLQRVILVGSLVEWTKKTSPFGMQVDCVQKWDEAADLIQNELDKNPLVLVKGSRDIGLDNLVERFVK